MKVLVTAIALMLAATSGALAWPNETIKMVVPFAAGGTTDVVARLVAERLSSRLGKPVVIENVAGAGGNTGAARVAKADADGYTILMATPGQAVMNQFMYSRMPYDTATAFVALAHVASVPSVLVVSPTMKVATAAEFLAAMRARPDGGNFGSAGMGSTGHLGGTLLSMKTGLKARHVPYRGSAPMLQDLLTGNIQFTIDTAPGVMSFIQSGSLLALAITGRPRAPTLPAVPDNAEAGIPDVGMSSWLVLLAPAATPRAIVERINAETEAAIAEPVLRDRILGLGAVPAGGPVRQVEQFLRDETAKWKPIVEAAAIRIE